MLPKTFRMGTANNEHYIASKDTEHEEKQRRRHMENKEKGLEIKKPQNPSNSYRAHILKYRTRGGRLSEAVYTYR